MTHHVDAGGRALEAARRLHEAAECTREVLRMSSDLIRRSREQTERIATTRSECPEPPLDEREPSKELVTCLIQAFELSEADNDAYTQALLGRVLNHVGRRIAVALGPKRAGLILN